MQIALTTQQTDELVRRLSLDREVDDYELVNDKHTYFLEAPFALQIDLAGRAKIVIVEGDDDEDSLRLLTRRPGLYRLDGREYIIDLEQLA